MDLKTTTQFPEVDKFLFYKGTLEQKRKLIENYIFFLAWRGFVPQKRDNTTCLTCASSIKPALVTSDVYGKFGFVPSYCDECNNKDYQAHLMLEHKTKYEASQARCGGYQNKLISHQGELVNFASISGDHKGQEYLIDVLYHLASGVRTRGFLLAGGTGIGKTYLTKCLHNELVSQCIASCHIKAVDLAILLRNAYRDELGNLLKDFKKCKVLIIDDLGAQKNTEMIKELLFSILDYRYENNLTTIITTNLLKQELEAQDSRLSSRFFDKKWIDTYTFMRGDLRVS